MLEPKEELQYLSEALGFLVTYTEFPQKTSQTKNKSVPEFITLVKLSTKPPKVSLCLNLHNANDMCTRGKSLFESWVTHFCSRLTATLNLCPIFFKLFVHVL